MAKKKIDLNSQLGSVNLSGKMSDFETAIVQEKSQSIQKIPISLIIANENNYYSIEDIEELAFLIKQVGQLQPALVIPQGDNYRLVAGERRYRALQSLHSNTIDAIVLDDLSEVDEQIYLISANAYRTKTEAERAREIDSLAKLFKEKSVELPPFLQGLPVNKAVAKQLNISEAQVYRAKRFTKLVPALQKLVDDSKIGMSTAQNFADLPEATQEEIAESINKTVKESGQFSRDEGDKLKKYYTNLISAKEADLEASQKQLAALEKEIERKNHLVAELSKKKDSEKKKDVEPKNDEKLQAAQKDIARLQQQIEEQQEKISILENKDTPPVNMESIERKVRMNTTVLSLKKQAEAIEETLREVFELRNTATEDFEEAAKSTYEEVVIILKRLPL